jgi:hypothetical protein
MPNDLARNIYKVPPLTDSAVMAHLWITRGYKVLPCQPDTKILIAGYGPNLLDLNNAEEIESWFRFRHANLAVVVPANHVVLDFDPDKDPEQYDRFITESPEAALSYTEETPRGGHHVFLAGENNIVPGWAEIVPGLEIKRVVLVYPSQVRGKQYRPVNSARILAVNLAEALQGFATVNIRTRSDRLSQAFPGAHRGNFQALLRKSRNHGRLSPTWLFLVMTSN